MRLTSPRNVAWIALAVLFAPPLRGQQAPPASPPTSSHEVPPYAFTYTDEQTELWGTTLSLCDETATSLQSSLDALQGTRNSKRRWYGGIGLTFSTVSAILGAVGKNSDWAAAFSVVAGAASVPAFISSGDQEAREAVLASLTPVREGRAALLQSVKSLSRSSADLDQECRLVAAQGASAEELTAAGCEEATDTVPSAVRPSELELTDVIAARHRFDTAWGDVEASLYSLQEACHVR